MPERWVFQTELSDITGFHVKSLQMMYRREPGVLVTRPDPNGSSRLQYKLPDTVVNLLKREKEAGKREKISRKSESAEGSRNEILMRKLMAETETAELELAQQKGDLIRLDVHEKRLDKICERISGVLDVIPSKFLSRIMIARTEVEAQAAGEAIRDETKKALFDLGDDVQELEKDDII